jgi:hypothetical protein
MIVPCGTEGHGAMVLDMPLQWRDGLSCDRAFLVFVHLLGSVRVQPSVLGYNNVLVCALTPSRRSLLLNGGPRPLLTHVIRRPIPYTRSTEQNKGSTVLQLTRDSPLKHNVT